MHAKWSHLEEHFSGVSSICHVFRKTWTTHWVRLNAEFQADIHWWHLFLEKWNGISCIWPIRESSCLFLAALRLRQLFIRIFNLSNLSCGRRNWRDSESISMPRNVSWHVGPTIFSGANGTPSSLQVSMIWCRLMLHSLEVGEPTVKKSSK